jgi:hypothetical protein
MTKKNTNVKRRYNTHPPKHYETIGFQCNDCYSIRFFAYPTFMSHRICDCGHSQGHYVDSKNYKLDGPASPLLTLINKNNEKQQHKKTRRTTKKSNN